MGMYTSILIQGIYKEEDLDQINDFLAHGCDPERSYSPLVNIMCGYLPSTYFGEYNYFNQFKLVEFLENMDWVDCIPENHVALFVMEDEDFKYHEHKLNIPDQNWKNFGKGG